MKHKPNFRNNNNKRPYQPKNNNNVQLQGLSVIVKDGDINFALRKFKKKVQDSGLLQTLREKEFYTKPSEARKRAKAAGRARHLKKMRSDPLANVNPYQRKK